MTGSRVDVLIPTYKPRPEHLTAGLKALQAQTFTDWTALVHDDLAEGSETEATVRPFLTDPRIRFGKAPRRLGIGGNWNACLTQTSAPIVAYLFQDDLWAPDYLANAVKVLQENQGVGFVSMGHEYHTEGGMDTGPLYAGLQEDRARLVAAGFHQGMEFLRTWIERGLAPNLVGEPDFVVMRRSVMEQAGKFHESMPQFLDVEYWIRLLMITDWYYESGNYGSFRVHPQGTSAVNQETGKGMYDRLTCLEELVRALTGDDRALAIRARNKSIEGMVAKFFSRVGSGKKVTTKGSGALRSFALRHPLLIAKAIVKALVIRYSDPR